MFGETNINATLLLARTAQRAKCINQFCRCNNTLGARLFLFIIITYGLIWTDEIAWYLPVSFKCLIIEFNS